MEAEVAPAPYPAPAAPYILTLTMDHGSQARFDRLRTRHYPAELNRIAAHLTLFHHLPQRAEVRQAVAQAALRRKFAMRVTGVRMLGRGVAYGVESEELLGLHRQLAGEFGAWLTPQDRQRFWPHVVVQNKVMPEAARALAARLAAEFEPLEVRAEGLGLWVYLGGPWAAGEQFEFQ